MLKHSIIPLPLVSSMVSSPSKSDLFDEVMEYLVTRNVSEPKQGLKREVQHCTLTENASEDYLSRKKTRTNLDAISTFANRVALEEPEARTTKTAINPYQVDSSGTTSMSLYQTAADQFGNFPCIHNPNLNALQKQIAGIDVIEGARHDTFFHRQQQNVPIIKTGSSESIPFSEPMSLEDSCQCCFRLVSDITISKRCSFCIKTGCATCIQNCESCYESFCLHCTTANYSDSYERIFCLDCQQNER